MYGNKLFVRQEGWNPGLSFLVVREIFNQKRQVAKPLEFIAIEENTCTGPTFTLDHDESQALINQLWGQGFRPTQSGSHVGQIGAMENHLADLRKILFEGTVFYGSVNRAAPGPSVHGANPLGVSGFH